MKVCVGSHGRREDNFRAQCLDFHQILSVVKLCCWCCLKSPGRPGSHSKKKEMFEPALGQHMGKDTVVVYLLCRGKFKAIAVCSSDGSSGSSTATTSTTASTSTSSDGSSSGSTTATTSTTVSTSTDASTSGSSIPYLVSSFLAKRIFWAEFRRVTLGPGSVWWYFFRMNV